MTYKMKPAGHKAPEEKREYVRPDSRLRSVFEEWLDGTLKKHNWSYINSFKAAEHLVSNLEATVEETHGLIITFKDYPKIIEAGLFLSAIYQIVPGREIVYDLDMPLDCLGHKLPAEKTLINNGETGEQMGYRASGPVINNSKTGSHMGWRASGPVINNGETGDWMGWRASGSVINNGTTRDRMGGYASGPVINNGETGYRMGECASGIVLALKEPESYGNLRKARIFKEKQIKANPKLHDYLLNLCEQTEAFTSESVMPPDFADRITQEIERLL